MRRREVIAGLAALSGGAVAGPVCAQQAPRIYRIGIIETVAPAHNKANLAALVGALRELGYVEGANLHIEYRSADGEAARFPEIAAELVAAGVDLIVTRGTPAALAAKNATQSIPIVMAAIGEPIGPGVVAQLARPGGNITGLSAFVTELQGKRVELIKEAVPGTTCVSALLNMGNPVSPPQWQETMRVTQALGLKARLVDVRRPDDLAAAIESAVKDGADALAVGIDYLIQALAPLIIGLAARHRLPTIYPSREFADDGGLLAYGVSYPNLYARAAGFIDRIFKGAKPSDLPVEQPTKMELVVNLKAADVLGLRFPPTLLARADEVIE